MTKRLALPILAAIALAIAVAVPAFAGVLNYRSHLSFGNEAFSLPIPSLAQGQATFKLDGDGTALTYRLNAANIDNVFMAHIHMGTEGANGPIVVWLYPSPKATAGQPIAGRFDGVLATGTITAADLRGPLAGHPLSDLVAAMQSGNAYVNVHTNDFVAPANTGPGDYPGGEIRGQIH